MIVLYDHFLNRKAVFMKFKLENEEIIEAKIIGEPPREIKWMYEKYFEVNGQNVWLLKQTMVWRYKDDQLEKHKPPYFYKKVGQDFYRIDQTKAISL